MHFVAAEVKRNGYIIGTYNSYEESKIAFEKIFELASKYPFPDTEKLNDDLIGYKKYVVRNIQFFVARNVGMATNGIFSIYIFELGEKWKTLEAFISEREFQVELFLE